MVNKFKSLFFITSILVVLSIFTIQDTAAAQGPSFHIYDSDQNWEIGDFELLTSIDDWAQGNLGDFPLLDLIGFWAAGCYHWDNSLQTYSDGCTSKGILLSGDPAAPASSAMKDYDNGERTTEAEVSTDSIGVRIDRTKLSISFINTATIHDINTLLNSMGGEIVNMMAGVNIIIIKIPDHGDLAGLEAVITQLENNPLVIEIARAVMMKSESLPGNYPSPSLSGSIDHHIAVTAPAAWNAKNALSYTASDSPLLLINDFFGDGPPNTDFDLLTLNPDNFNTGALNAHGYHVLGIISGKHNLTEFEISFRHKVTGIYPGKLSLLAEDTTLCDWSTCTNEMLKIVKAFKRVVINTSLSLDCSSAAGMTPQECTDKYARLWLKKVRGNTIYNAGAPGGRELEFIHLTAAGNDYGAPAINSSAWTAARLRSGLKNDFNINLPNLTNTLVVENRLNTAAVPYKPACLHGSSNYPGDISAIGTDVFSFTEANSTGSAYSGADILTGTSMATPQVAGLAAYVWALKPSLTPQEVLDILMKTSRTPSNDPVCGGIRPQPVIDAYAAVLAADDTSALNTVGGNTSDAPARLAVLDVLDSSGLPGENNSFDYHDLERFINEIVDRGGNNLDYSRYDLNGDGYTGGEDKKTRFNLDINYPPAYEIVNHNIDGQKHEFDENSVSDLEILCYYAYSPLYTGDEAQRDVLLEPHKIKCGEPKGNGNILFTRFLDQNKSEIYSMNSFGGDVTMLVSNSSTWMVPDASYSPDLQKIVYSYGGTNSGDIWVMNSDGTNKTNLINDISSAASARDDRYPEWSPDGSKILFIRAEEKSQRVSDRGGQIYVINSDGTGMRRLTDDIQSRNEKSPEWSPDGSRIAFVGDGRYTPSIGGFHDGLFVINVDGSNEKMVIEEDDDFADKLSWSPGGSMIYFISYRTGNYDIYSISASGGGLQNLTNSPENEGQFVISPEGSKIAFTRSIGFGPGDLFVMSTQGTNEVKVASNAELPIWSPDSTEIAFYNDATPGIAAVDTFGNNLRILDNLWSIPTDWK